MTVHELEQAKLSEIAAEYRSKGYSVGVRPRPEELPAFLSGYKIDLVAESPRDNVVVEVSSGPSLERTKLVRIAEVVKMDVKVEDGKVLEFRTRLQLSFKYQS